MKKVFLALAVAAVFVACDSKKKEGEEKKEGTGTEQVTPPAPPAGDTGKMATPPAGDTGKTAMEAGKDAMNKGAEAVKDAKAGDVKGATEKGKEAMEAGKDAMKKATN